MDKVKYFKNFSVYYCKSTGNYVLKLEVNINGSCASTTILITEAEWSRINKLITNYDNDVKEILSKDIKNLYVCEDIIDGK